MTVDYLRWLCAYDQWANARYFEKLAELPAERLTQPLVSSFPTLLATLTHLVGVEWAWLSRWRGVSPSEGPSWYRQPTLAGLRMALAQVEQERFAFLDGLHDEQLNQRIEYRLLGGVAASGQLGVLIQHAVNHSTFHRGQLATLMRQVGGVPPGSDLDDFPQAAPL
jgi:uncharacterized damage-inducible protein DinB